MKTWWEVEIQTTEEAAEAVADLLLREGAAGVATEDPADITALIEAPDSLIFTDAQFLQNLPDYVRVRAYFAAHKASELESKISKLLDEMRSFLDVGRGLLACRAVQEEDWANNWKAHYHPFKVSERLSICPSWEPYAAQANELVIKLDPGSAFGTGEHASTALCLRLLDELPLQGRSCLDLGCGSGILAIAAAKLGAAAIEAVDIDPNAVQVARDNAQQNEVQALIDCYVAELQDCKQSHYQVIAANILAEVHVLLAPAYAQKLSPGGTLILGGIIGHKLDAVKSALLEAGLQLCAEVHDGDWFALKYDKIQVD